MNNREKIDELERLHREFMTLFHSLPECSAKTMVEQEVRRVARTLSKLDEDLVCDVCKQDIEDGQELAFYYKQTRHAACHKN
jgi:hypothetical protein